MAKETKENKSNEWFVIVPFFDLIQRKEVDLGDVVEHTEEREKLGLIELK